MGGRYVRSLGWHSSIRVLVLGSRKSFSEDGGNLWGGRGKLRREGDCLRGEAWVKGGGGQIGGDSEEQ